MEKKCKKAKWLSGAALQIAVKRREAKSKGEKERYKHLNAEFQRIARRDKKSCRDQEGRRGSEEAVPGPSVFLSSETGVSRNIWCRIKGTKYRFALQDGTWFFS